MWKGMPNNVLRHGRLTPPVKADTVGPNPYYLPVFLKLH